MGLDGKTCIVTGASRGIGYAATLAIAAAGARVVASARDADACRAVCEDVARAGGEAVPFAADVSDPGAMAALADFSVSRFGAIHLSFLNAGNILPPLPLEAIDDARFDSLIDVNLRGVFFALRAQLPYLYRQGGAVVINSAGSGLRGRAGLADYCASKWGVIGLAMAAAQEAGPKNVRVNVIAPGFIASESWVGMLGDRAQALAARVPLTRIGTPEEIADAVVWLLGDGARYISGTVIPIDGGMLSG